MSAIYLLVIVAGRDGNAPPRARDAVNVSTTVAPREISNVRVT